MEINGPKRDRKELEKEIAQDSISYQHSMKKKLLKPTNKCYLFILKHILEI